MFESCTCHLPIIMALFSLGVEYLGQAEALKRHGADIVVSDITELEGRR